MPAAQPENPHIIGLTGSFGSGCSFIAEHILAHRGYEWLSLSGSLRKRFKDAKGVHDDNSIPRCDLQKFGDELRAKHGPTFLAQEVLGEVQSDSGASPTRNLGLPA